MKQGIITLFYNEKSKLRLDSLSTLTKNKANIVLCFVNNDPSEASPEAISNHTHLVDSIYFINVSSDIDSIALVDPEQSTSFSECPELMKTFGKTRDWILPGLKNTQVFKKQFDYQVIDPRIASSLNYFKTPTYSQYIFNGFIRILPNKHFA